MHTSLFQQFYRTVRQIPRGKVATYGQIARLSGHPRCARQVGFALSLLPQGSDVPAHRVINRKGEMAPEHVFGSCDYQRFLLEQEGICFSADGTVDLATCQWQPQDA